DPAHPPATWMVTAPACLDNVVSVAATYPNDHVATGYSANWALLDLLAPGGLDAPNGILSSIPNGSYARMNGTSMAAPHVAGAFAVLRQRSPLATTVKLLKDLVLTGTPS